MQPPHTHPALLSAIIGFLLMILAAGLLAEKPHEGHLPERNDRGANNAPAAAGIFTGMVIQMTAIPGTADRRNSTKVLSHQNAREMMPCRPALP
jgi:hypothetical protein